MTENLKLQLSTGFAASYDIKPGNGVGLFWDTYTYLLNCPGLARDDENS